MKKLIATILFASVVLLCGCSGGQSSAQPEPTGSAASPDAPVGTSKPSETSAPSASATSAKALADFEPICQYPELPTGCEVTSLAMVLNHYGVNCDKCEISDSFLTKGEVGTVDFHKAFEGDPRDEYSYGCYAGVIVEAAERVIADRGSSLTVTDKTGSEVEELFTYIDRDIPVIVWGTQDCTEGQYTVTWTVDGQDLTWFSPEHCMVLVGYDEYTVTVADPIYGELVDYDINAFKSCYASLFKQAVIIE